MGNQNPCSSVINNESKYQELIVCGKQPEFRNSTIININNNNIPIIHGPPLDFHKNGTFQKVEKAAAEFCLKNQLDKNFIPLVARIIAYGHHINIFKAYQRLQYSQQMAFLEQLKYFDFEFMDSLYHNFILGQKQEHSYMTSPIYTCKKRDFAPKQIQRYINLGKTMLRNRNVGIILLCAGSSSRFQNQDKFIYPLNLKSQKTILQIYFERIRKNFGIPEGQKADINILIACNDLNRYPIEQYLKSKKYFGFNISKIKFFTVQNLPVLDKNGKICLTFQNKVLEKPCGTAKCIQEFLNSGSYHFFNVQNIQIVHIVGCQNLAESPADPLYIGYLVHHKLQLLGKCVDPLYTYENFIRYASSKTRNYCLSPQKIKQISGNNHNKVLEQCPIAMNSMICQLNNLKILTKDYNNSMFLSKQFRAMRAYQNYYNFQEQRPEINSEIIYFQKDLQHFISCTKNHKLIKVDQEDFIPLLSKNNSYSLKQASKRLIQFHQKQIREQSRNS